MEPHLILDRSNPCGSDVEHGHFLGLARQRASLSARGVGHRIGSDPCTYVLGKRVCYFYNFEGCQLGSRANHSKIPSGGGQGAQGLQRRWTDPMKTAWG